MQEEFHGLRDGLKDHRIDQLLTCLSLRKIFRNRFPEDEKVLFGFLSLFFAFFRARSASISCSCQSRRQDGNYGRSLRRERNARFPDQRSQFMEDVNSVQPGA